MAYIGIGFLPLIVALPIALFAFHDVDDPKVAKRAEGLAVLNRETGNTMAQYGFTFLKRCGTGGYGYWARFSCPSHSRLAAPFPI